MDEAERLLEELVALPSMNPMGRSDEGIGFYEAEIAQFVAEYLRSRKVDVEMSKVSPRRPCVIGSIRTGASHTVMLEAHLDTVRAESMGIDPFVPAIREGKLFGRGACDTKGSLAAFFHAACSLLEKGRSLNANVLLVAVPDEEYGFTGARHVAAKGLKADFGIVGEPTALRIVSAHKGVMRWNIITHGLAAHSAYPERGRNAISTMGRVLVRLEQYAELLHQGRGHPRLGSPTMSVGVIEGGEAVNVIPHRCRIEVDRRTLPGETEESVLGQVRSLLDDLAGCEIEEPYLSVAGMEVAQDAEVFRPLGDAIRDVTGDLIIETAHYATDAGIYNAAGIPTIVFGPGDIAQAHAGEEYIDLRQFHAAIEIIQRMLT